MQRTLLLKETFHTPKKYNKIPKEYENELLLQLMLINLNREAILSVILLIIDLLLLALDFWSSRGWSRDVHIYTYFSYMHVILMIIPAAFLLIIHNNVVNNRLDIKLLRILHYSINSLVLIFCALISICNGVIDRLPYPYIIAMFCIGSVVMLDKRERIFVYVTSCLIYIIGCAMLRPDTYHFIRNTFFIVLLVIIAMIVSSMHFSSFINDFINHRIIVDKNAELNRLYKEAEEALIQRTNELNETVEYEKLRASFFANISHELRTPLTVIFSAEQMLNLIIGKEVYAERDEHIRQYTEIIKQNCYRLIRLVANLIDITKIDAGYFHVSLKNCDIIKVVEDITLSVAKFIEDREINLVFDTDLEEQVLACDPDKIERIMLNLLSNAVKFTPRGGSIYVDINDKADEIEIHIKDTGIGIPENMRQSIFERFVQVDKTISRNQEGSGIGLSLVKSLVDMHNGTINLLSEEGNGSEFIIALPKVKVDSEEETVNNNFVNEKHNVEKINIEFSDIYK